MLRIGVGTQIQLISYLLTVGGRRRRDYFTPTIMATEIEDALAALRKNSADVQQRLNAVQEHVNEYGGGEIEHDGVSLLQLKSVALLRYCGNLSRYGALRLGGTAPPETLRAALCADWATLERIRPLEKRLRPQLDALVAAAREEEVHRPNPAAMLGASDSESEGDDAEMDNTDAYVPPKFAETVYDGGQDDAKIRRRDEARRERMRRGAGARAMMAELRGLPDEIREPKLRDVSGENRERTRFEEENFVRLAQTKKQRKDAERAAKVATGEIEDMEGGLMCLEKWADGVLKKSKSKSDGEKTHDIDDEMEEKVRALDQVESGGSSGGRGRRTRDGGGRGNAKRRKRA